MHIADLSLQTLPGFLAVISILIGFVCGILGCFLIVTPSERRTANLFFAAFLILTAIDVSGWLFPGSSASDAWVPVLRLDLAYLQMPAFAAFILATCFEDFALRRRDVLHCLPFLIALYLGLPGHQLGGFDWHGPHLGDAEQIATITGLHLQYYLYIGWVSVALVRFRRAYVQQYAGADPVVLRWLVQLIGVSLFVHTLVVVRTVAAFGGAGGVASVLEAVGAVIALGILSWITLNALRHPEVFRTVDPSLAVGPAQSNREIGPNADSPEARHLLDHMEAATPYLDAELTLASLARQLGMAPRDLSELINQTLGVHFFDFINRYRIEWAKQRLLDDPRVTILEILYAAGFNSKSSFNAAFRRCEGMSPTQFRSARAERAAPAA
tara:strand:- start:6355 stop:7503 length:1149 start_codon:yes stop_codon:yes gene_type:complete